MSRISAPRHHLRHHHRMILNEFLGANGSSECCLAKEFSSSYIYSTYYLKSMEESGRESTSVVDLFPPAQPLLSIESSSRNVRTFWTLAWYSPSPKPWSIRTAARTILHVDQISIRHPCTSEPACQAQRAVRTVRRSRTLRLTLVTKA